MPSCAAAGNLLLTSPGSTQSNPFPVNGTINGQPITSPASTPSAYNIQSSGVGTLSMTVNSNTANYVLYAIDGTDFYLIEEDKGVAGPVLFMTQ